MDGPTLPLPRRDVAQPWGDEAPGGQPHAFCTCGLGAHGETAAAALLMRVMTAAQPKEQVRVRRAGQHDSI